MARRPLRGHVRGAAAACLPPFARHDFLGISGAWRVHGYCSHPSSGAPRAGARSPRQGSNRGGWQRSWPCALPQAAEAPAAQHHSVDRDRRRFLAQTSAWPRTAECTPVGQTGYPNFLGARRQVSNSTQVGAWSLVFSHPRGVRSTPADFSTLATGGLSRKWSIRMPAFRSNEFRQ